MKRKIRFNFSKVHWPLFTFLIFYFVFALITYKDYGITADEGLEYRGGKEFLTYFSQEFTIQNTVIPILALDTKSQLYVPLFIKYYRFYQMLVNTLNPAGYYERYHLLNFLFATPVFIAIYAVIYLQYKKPFWAILGPIFLFLTPRFMGDLPANPKDIPFAVAFFSSLLLIFIVKKFKNLYIKILVFGGLFGLTQSLRTVGFSIYIVYLFFIVYTYLVDEKKLNRSFFKYIASKLLELSVIFIVASFFMVITMPYLGANYFTGIPSLLRGAQTFFWNKEIVFMGKFIMPIDRPWYYLPVYIFVTTPISILILSTISLINIKKLFKNRLFFLMLTALLSNLFIYLILHPVVYNGLRHFLYLLPIFVVLALISFIQIKTGVKKIYKYLVLGLAVVNLLTVAFQMLKLHPYEYIYFNEIVGGLEGAHTKFETDYWAASFKESVEWFNSNVSGGKVYPCNVSFAVLYYSKGKLDIVGKSAEAQYTICDYYMDRKNSYGGKLLFIVRRLGVPLTIIRQKY